MSGKKTLIALSAALTLGVLGAAPAAQAGDGRDDQVGGFRVGPLGQLMGTPSQLGVRSAPSGANAYSYALSTPKREHSRPLRID